jgi:hypothetical protein
LGSSAAPRRGSTYLPHVRRAHPPLRLINNSYACTRLPGSHKNRTTSNLAQPDLIRHQRTVPPELCANDATNTVTVICSHSAMATSPAIVRLALSVDLSERITSTFCVPFYRSTRRYHPSTDRKLKHEPHNSRNAWSDPRHMGTKYRGPRKVKIMNTHHIHYWMPLFEAARCH